MTFAPPTLVALGHYWTSNGGVNLGVVGDASHVGGGTSYHLGKSQLKPTAYSIRTARDKAGLTEAASAMDLGRLNGTLAGLRTFSIWFVEQARADAPGFSDIREIIYSPDGTAVLRWDRERGHASLPRSGEADTSHRTHTHVSWYRDAQARDHTTAFRPYFETGEIVNSYPVPKAPSVGNVATGKVIYPSDAMTATDPLRIIVDPGRDMPFLGDPSATCRIIEYVDDHGVHSGKSYFIHSADLTSIRPVTPPAPDCTAAVAAAVAPLNAQIVTLDAENDTLTAQLAAANAATATAATTERTRIAESEAARIEAI